MQDKNEIKSEKILVKDIFTNMWFRIPEYQRPYIWGVDQINDLLDDLIFANAEKPDQEYFLGSIVFQAKTAEVNKGLKFVENDLLDGQQRMTTLFLLFACIRDLCDDPEVKEICIKAVFQKGNRIHKIPERTRLVFEIRESSQDFVNEYVKAEGGTKKIDQLTKLAKTKGDPSLRNMATAILEIHKFLADPSHAVDLENFVTYLSNKVLLIYVSTENLDDAFRLFTILNNRGIPLRNSDILKSQNLGALVDGKNKKRYAELWESAESELGEDFDRFLNYLRTILVKDKARLSLLDEFEQKIYSTREIDKASGKQKPPLLTKGEMTFKMVERYLKHYSTLLGGDNFQETGNSYCFDNLIKVMLTGLPSTEWLPPLMKYFDCFGHEKIFQFLVLLDNKFSADWVAQYTPSTRLENMNQIIRIVESASDASSVINDCGFSIDSEAFKREIDLAVYGKRFTRYLLLKLDFIYRDNSQRLNIESPSVEHILPQNPSDESQWMKKFTEEQRNEWTDRLGNLVLITSKKNSSQGRLDYTDKKSRYFEKRISSCPNSLRVLNKYSDWTPAILKDNHEIVLKAILNHYGVE